MSTTMANNKDVDEETIALVKNYKIPRKDKDKEPKSLLQEIAFNSREYQQDVYPILKQNYYQRIESEKNFHYIHCYLVNSPYVVAQFEARKKEMKSSNLYTDKDLTFNYGFLEVISLVEAKKICMKELSSGNRILGCLGQPKLGVYLSRYSDVLTAAPLVSGSSGTFIMFKFMKGRHKVVPLQSAHLEPSPNFDCHIAKCSPSDLQTASPLKLYEYSQIYLYEYNDTDLSTKVRHICPVAVITYDYGSPLARTKDYLLWTGTVICGSRCVVSRIQLFANYGKMKPYSLGKALQIKKLTSFSCAAEWQPIQELQSEQIQSVFHRRREVRLSNGMCVSLFRFANDRSDEFNFLVEKLMQNYAVGLATLRGGTILLIFPTSEFSDQIGIPRYCDTLSSLHCLVIGYRSCVTGIGFTKDPYDVSSTPGVVASSFRVNLSKLQASKPPPLEPKPSLSATGQQNSPPALISDEDLRPLAIKAMARKHTNASVSNDVSKSQTTANSFGVTEVSQASSNAPSLAETTNKASVLDPRLSKIFSMLASVSTSSNGGVTASAPISSPQTQETSAAVPQMSTGTSQIEELERKNLSELDKNKNISLPSPLSPHSSPDDVEPIYDPSDSRLDVDLEFITLEDTPSSPGPLEPETRKENYKPPVIVPLESVRQTLNSDPKPSEKQSHLSSSSKKDTFAWPQISQKAIDEMSIRSKSVLLSHIEKAIISGGSLRKSKKPKHRPRSSTNEEEDGGSVKRKVSTSDEVEPSDDRLVIDEISEPSTSKVVSNKSSTEENDTAVPQSSPLVNESNFIDLQRSNEEQKSKKFVKGLLIPDDLIFLKTSTTDAEQILNHFYQMHRLGTADWCMKVHSQMVLKLADHKKNLDPESDAHDRVTKLLVLLTRYRNLGRVELLSRHDCDISSRASKDYLSCLKTIRQGNTDHFCVFLSNLNRSSQPAREFSAAGIIVANVQTFIDKFLK